MKVPQLGEVLRDVFSISDKSDLEYSLNEDGVLNVTLQGAPREYVLLKLTGAANENSSPLLLQPEFTLKDTQNETYGAFRREFLRDFVAPERNNLVQLRVILKTLAELQASTKSETNTTESEYLLEDITPLLDYFEPLGKAEINEVLVGLQSDFNGLLKSTLLVKSIWSCHSDNVFVSKYNTSSLFFDTSSSQQPLPPAYDAFLYIFSLSDEHFRQKHFESLTSLYFKSLAEALEVQNNDLHKEVTRSYAERQLKHLLPAVKLKVLAETNPSSQQFEEILGNLTNFFRNGFLQQEDVYQAVKNKLSSDDYSLLSYKLVPLTTKNGHLGEYFQLPILVRVDNKEETLNLFGKFLVAPTELFKMVIESGVGKKEDFFYSTLYPLYQDHGLGCFLDFAPKCYLSRLSGILILDDLNSLGYTGLKPNAVMTEDGIKLALKQLAKLHASSFIVEEILSKQQQKIYRFDDDYAEYFEEVVLQYNSTYKPFYEILVTSLCWTINKFPDLVENLGLSQEELRDKFKSLVYSPFSKVKKSDTIRNVINHGDMYISNMLFKFGNSGQTVDEVVLIDFQILRYMPPAYEMLFFIFLCSTKETRDKHLPALLNFYYDTLSSCIRQFDLDPEEIYSRKHFEEDVKYTKPAAVQVSFNYGHMLHIDPDFREEIMHDEEKSKYYLQDHRDELMELSWEEEHYRCFLRGLMEDMVDLIKNRDV